MPRSHISKWMVLFQTSDGEWGEVVVGWGVCVCRSLHDVCDGPSPLPHYVCVCVCVCVREREGEREPCVKGYIIYLRHYAFHGSIHFIAFPLLKYSGSHSTLVCCYGGHSSERHTKESVCVAITG